MIDGEYGLSKAPMADGHHPPATLEHVVKHPLERPWLVRNLDNDWR